MGLKMYVEFSPTKGKKKKVNSHVLVTELSVILLSAWFVF